MNKKEPNIGDQILDLLLEALQERQRTREAATSTKPLSATADFEPEKKAEPPADEVRETPTEPVVEAVEAVSSPSEPADLGPEPDDDGDDGEARVEQWPEILDPEPSAAEPLPSVSLNRWLRQLFAVLGILVIVINIPFNRYGLSLARAMPDSAALIIRDGVLLKGSGDEVYVLENNQRRWITTLDAFEAYGYRWSQVHEVDDAFLNDFEEGLPIHLLLKCRTSPHIYALEDGKKRWIKDIPTFEARQYIWEDVRFVSCDYLRNLPDGLPIPEDAGTPPQP